MPTFSNQETCLVTGAGGYLGGRVKAALEKRGWRVIELTHNPKSGGRAVRFQLGEELPPEILAGAKALVHCAYDFKQLSWADIHRVNVEGSEKLLRAARQARIEKVIYI